MLIFESLLGFFQPSKSRLEVTSLVLADLAVRLVESPYGIALDIDEDLSLVEAAILRLEAQGIVQRSESQIIVPDEGEEIPRVYVRYELVGAPS